MDKTPTANQKRASKQPKTKKKQPLKVVYIANPIKFKASASEFKALVQELTGQDADTPETPSRFTVADGVGGGRGEVANAAAEDDGRSYVHAKIGETSTSSHVEGVQNGSNPSSFGSTRDDDDDVFCTPQMVDDFQGLWSEAAHLDVFKSLDSM